MEGPRKPTHFEDAEKESLRSKIVDRMLWIKDKYGDSPATIIAAMIDAGYEFRQNKDLADYMIDNQDVANNVADMLEVDVDKLMSKEFIPKEEFFKEYEG